MAFHRGYPVRSLNSLYHDLEEREETWWEAPMEKVIAGNRKTGRVLYVGGGTYVFERPGGKRGAFETRKVRCGGHHAAYLEWVKWCVDGDDPQMIKAHLARKGEEWNQAVNDARVERLRERAEAGKNEPEMITEKKEEQMAQKTTREDATMETSSHIGPMAMPKSVYVLSYRNGRTSKLVAAYLTDAAALDMAEALGVALEVSGAEGEYTVDELQVRS